MTLEPDIHSGTLADNHILQAADQHWLISENFDRGRVKQACYELRAGNIYYELDRADRSLNPVRHELQPAQYILLKPKQFITIITHESIRLPPNVLGRVLTKGQLFSIGVVPVNTYADPGFEGKLGIVLANLSNNYLKITQLQPIAKIEFSKLRHAVETPYVGQHGYQTQMWPIPYHMVLTSEELKRDPRVQSSLDELETSHGKLIAGVFSRILRFERYLLFAGIGYFLLSAILLALLAIRHDGGPTLSTVLSVTVGVVSNLIFAVLVYISTSFKR